MKKMKCLVLTLVMMLCLALCSCEWFHTHDYDWVNGEDYQKAYLRCKTCYMPFDPDKLYDEPVKVEGSIGGDLTFTSLIYYEIYVDSGHFDYGEEFDITLKIEIRRNYIELGEFSVMLSESPYFEFVGDNEQSILISEEDYNQFREFKFRIKVTDHCRVPQDFEFRLKFNDNKYFKRDAAVDWGQLPWYYLPDEEYFYGFKHLSFINDSHGIFIEDSTRRAYLFHNSINREYLAGLLDKDTYIDRVREYVFSNGTYTIALDENTHEIESTVRCRYLSPNFRAKFNLLMEGNIYRILKDYEDNYENGEALCANMLVDMLYAKGYISYDEYLNELEYIYNAKPNLSRFSAYPEMMPIAEYYEEHFYDYTYTEDGVSSYNSSNTTEGNNAYVYLSSDKIDVSGGMDVEIHTAFSNTVEDFVVLIEEGLELDSEIDLFDDKIVFSLAHNDEYLTPHFKMGINFDGEDTDSIEIDVYGYVEGDYLYLSQWSANEAYNVFMEYANASVEDETTIEEIQQELSENRNDSSNVSVSYEIIDTEIRGTFYWQEYRDEDDNIKPRVFPLQFVVVSFYDRQAIGERYLGSCLTNSDGEYSFKFLNDTSSTENGGLDITIRVWAAGDDVCVTHGPKLIPILYTYYNDIVLEDNIATGLHEQAPATFKMFDCEENTALFGQALQICQAAIFASKYYEEMKGSDVVNVPIVYPHKENYDNCFYRKDDLPSGRIYIIKDTKQPGDLGLRSYEAWDVIMHEYGHFVADKEGFYNSPGGWHNGSMAEHYQTHFNNGSRINCSKSDCVYNYWWYLIATEDNCKINGTSIAFNEGWATYFSMVSQEYYSDYIGEIKAVADRKSSSYDGGDIKVARNVGTTEDSENTISSILYDLYDSPPDDPDSFDDFYGCDFLSLGHRTVWLLVINSKAITFDEFDDYFQTVYKNTGIIEKYAGLLSYHKLAPGDRYDDNADAMVPAITVDGTLSTACPTFLWKWEEIENNLFFSDRTFVLNFYNESFELIGSTPEQSKDARSVTISETLWQAVLDSGSKFYVSVTVIENHSPKTEYEGQWYEFEISLEIPTANEQTQYTVALSDGQYYWYSFTAHCSTTYTFKTSGNVDTTGAVFSKITAGGSLSGALASNDNYQDDNDFTIKTYISAGETVYIRIGINGETTEESFDFWIFGEHNFTSSYTPNDLYGHTAYCECGANTYDSHDWVITEFSSRCRLCLYVTQRTIVPVFKSSVEEEEQILYYYDKKEENE